MKILYILLLAIVCFSCTLLGGKKYRSSILYALAIGGIVNSNFFHAGNFPIYCFSLPFGIDSVIYSLFVFCVILMLLEEDRRSAYILMFSSIAAIFFSASMQLVADLTAFGSSLQAWQTFGSFCISMIASLLALCATIELVQFLRRKKLNIFLVIILGMTVATLVNSTIYYGASTLVFGITDNFANTLLASFIGKGIAIICSLVAFMVMKIKNKNYVIINDNLTNSDQSQNNVN